MKFQPTITIHNELDLVFLQPGQWFKLGYSGAKGQYLGKTRSGTIVCRYGKFSKDNAKRNNLQRQYAINHGSK